MSRNGSALAIIEGNPKVDGMLVMSDDRQTAVFLAQSAMDAELQQDDAVGKFGDE